MISTMDGDKVFALARVAGIQGLPVARSMSDFKKTHSKTIDDVSFMVGGKILSFDQLRLKLSLAEARLIRKKEFYPTIKPEDASSMCLMDIVHRFFQVCSESDLEVHRQVQSNSNFQVPDFERIYGSDGLAPLPFITSEVPVTKTLIRKQLSMICRFCMSFYGLYSNMFSHLKICSFAKTVDDVHKGDIIRLWSNFGYRGGPLHG